MVYNVSFMYNGVGCANLVDADADIETAKEYFIQEKLNGDRSRFVGISENNESYKPGKYSGSVVKTKIQAFYNEPISVAELGRCPR